MKAVVGFLCFLSCCQLLNSGGVCVDLSSSCRIWANANECVNNPSYMQSNCPVSCHTCGPCQSFPCPADTDCISESTDPGANYTCVCFDGYIGDSCADSPCVGVRCQKGGHCVVNTTSPSGYTCICPTAITGTHCEVCNDLDTRCDWWAGLGECENNPVWMLDNCRISCPQGCPETDLCNPNPCQNGGTCYQNGTCNCTGTGFMGNTCEASNSCNPNPCLNGGAFDIDGSCNCTGTGFTGNTSEANDPCDPNPCRNGGTCNPGGMCNCTGTGFMGSTCEVNNSCDPDPCRNGGICNPNGTCDCTGTGFSGNTCEVNNSCDPNPCRNGGICNQNGTCDCAGTGFMGTTCEVAVNNSCNPNPCQNGGTCNPDGTCNCTGTGFTGNNCSAVVCPHTMAVSGYVYQEVPVPDISMRTSLVFATRACQNAHMALSTSLNLSSNIVEIVVGAGANTYLSIRNCKLTCELTSKSAVLLSCDVFKWFWVSWEASAVTNIILGLGSQVGADVFVTQSLDVVLDVNHVSIASFGSDVGTWVFDFPEQTNTAACQTTASPTTEMTTETTTATSTQEVTTETPTTETTTLSATTTEAAVETTTKTKPTPSPNQLRHYPICRCTKVKAATAEDKDKAQQAVVEIKKTLTIKEETSSQTRSKTSAKDARPSAESMGSLAIAILVCVLVLLVAPDLISIGMWLRKKAKKPRKRAEDLEELDTHGGGNESPRGGSGHATMPNNRILLTQIPETSAYSPNPERSPTETAADLDTPSGGQSASEDTTMKGTFSKTPSGQSRPSVLKTLIKAKAWREMAPTNVLLDSQEQTSRCRTNDDDLDLEVITSANEAASEVNRNGGISKKRKPSTAWTEV